ncbi:RNA polymerase sigma factor [Chitinophaga tropicalis]|uniref:RNA polymerase sigma-70 factor n=1 Tax=Chitinophaga tropicalis TaxID=2683588 RepID=A0A7K1TZY7_9BACT|nr:RNA polymerase sigma-70 factor [Chitinophaga tropicalis]MVT07677.1 RNA polymerase sigma-70 factor [Chitinophaga tropicalis]
MSPSQQLNSVFKEIYRKYYPRVYATAYSLLRQHEKAQDISQSVFLRLWEGWDTITPENLESYLVTMAKHAVLNEFRKNAVQARYKTYLKERFQESTDNVEEQAILRQQLSLLEEAVQQLPTRQQEAWRLSREKGMTYKEIGEAMHISKTSVKELLQKAVQALKSALQSFRSYLLV